MNAAPPPLTIEPAEPASRADDAPLPLEPARAVLPVPEVSEAGADAFDSFFGDLVG